MSKHAFPPLVLSAAMLLVPFASAADFGDTTTAAKTERFFTRVGAAHIVLSEEAKLHIAGIRLPDASIHIGDHTTAMAEIGYRLNPNFSLALAGGFPPNIDVNGTGNAEPFGRIGGLTYGPVALTLQYQVREWGWFQPYVGAGPMVMFVFDNHDGAMSDFDIDSAVGIVGQVGADMMLNERFGIFADAKKAYLRSDASGSLGGAQVDADVKLDPFVLSGGLTLRF